MIGSWAEFQVMMSSPAISNTKYNSLSGASPSLGDSSSMSTLSASKLSRVAPRDVSETHVMAAWDQIGLVKPVSSVKTPNMHRRVVFKD